MNKEKEGEQRSVSRALLEKSRYPIRGFSLVEMLFYVVILSFALLIVTETLIILTRSFGSLRATQRIEQEGGFLLERMVREIRDATSVDASSSLGTHPGKLVLISTTALGTPKTVEFYLDAGRVHLKEDGVVIGALSSEQTTITNLIFKKITTARSEGVKIEMTVGSGTGRFSRSENLLTTAVLRDSY